MSAYERIQELQSLQKGDLRSIIAEQVEILFEDKEYSIPSDVVVDIIIQANRSNNFGSEMHEAEYIIATIARISKGDIPIKDHFQLLCIGFSLILTNLSVDEQNNSNDTSILLSPLGVPQQSTRTEMLRAFLMRTEMIGQYPVETWYLEYLSFTCIYLALIKTIGKWSDVEEKRLTALEGILPYSVELEEWRSSWVEKNDYFRLNSLFILGTHPSETILPNMFKKLLG